MEAKLVIVSGASKAAEFKLKLPTVIGRSRSVDLPLGHSLVSRQHCELFEDDGVLKLRDLGSLNGTFIGETRIAEEIVLEPGAQFTVGPVTFRAVYGIMPPRGDLSSSNVLSSPEELPPRDSSFLDQEPDALDAALPANLDTVDESFDPAAAGADAQDLDAPPGAGDFVDDELGDGEDELGVDDELSDGGLGDGGVANGGPAPGAASELATEELQEFAESGNFLPPAPPSLDADQFDWLNEDAASVAPPRVDDVGPEEAPASGKASQEVKPGRGKPAEKKPVPKAPAKKGFGWKKPAAEKKPAEKQPAQKADAKNADTAGEKSPAQAGAAQSPAAQPNAAPAEQNSADDQDFMPPMPSHAAPAAESDPNNVFDFLQ